MFQTKVVGKIKTHISFSITFSENCALYKVMWENLIKPVMPQITV